MNDFKIVKCKKCDAGLVELAGQTLERCEQCGYDFGMPNKTKTVFNTSSAKSGHKTLNKEKIINEVTKGSPSLSEIIKRVQQKVAEHNNQNPKPKTKPAKKKKSWIITMIKWYFISAIGLGLLSKIFSR
jgi:hypothetical protein